MVEPVLRFVHISDTHIPFNPDHNVPVGDLHGGARALVREINQMPFVPDFVLHTGDVAYDRDPQDYFACREILGEIRYPVYYVAGNGDDVVALQSKLIGREVPVVPFHYEFEVNGVQVVVVDSNDSTRPPAGSITEPQLAWLNALCSAEDERPLIIATHHNPQVGGIPWLDNVTGIQNTEAFHAAILPARERLRGVFFGHVHQNLDVYRDGILYCSASSSWIRLHAWPGQTENLLAPQEGPGFSVVSVYANQTVIRRHSFSM